ncbi:hypothetical protein NE237_022565 [Protea cynaroides]|uniref:Isopenicillin N synthase-like Fe(2+) 2OG dioxygenase domain-containing protein n=1 Tax=Protea cynaroides TaxID=273540 RepID=A0A9Q0K4C0_9MAGN|nr:hypothetical protein NE237_022565 [Protea cynaroides]
MNNKWPEYPSDLRDACEEYCRAVEKLSFKLLELISLSLGFFIRLNHYPPCPTPDLAPGVGRHKDIDAPTILATCGLKVKRKTYGEWVRVMTIPESYIIKVGDVIQRERERFSIPFVLNPSHYEMVKPLEEPVDEEKEPAARYKAYNWGKFISARKLSNFKKLTLENVQITDLKISK